MGSCGEGASWRSSDRGPSCAVNHWVVPSLSCNNPNLVLSSSLTQITRASGALPTRSDRNEQIGDGLSSAAERSSGLAGRCCWSHAASSDPTVRY